MYLEALNCVSKQTYIHIHIPASQRHRACVDTYIHIHIHTYSHTHIFAYTHIHTHTYSHTYIFIFQPLSDVVRVYQCTQAACTQQQQLVELSGTYSSRNAITSTTAFMKITFTSDSSVNYDGFAASWTTVRMYIHVGMCICICMCVNV